MYLEFGSWSITVVWVFRVRGTDEQRLVGGKEGMFEPLGLYTSGSATC